MYLALKAFVIMLVDKMYSVENFTLFPFKALTKGVSHVKYLNKTDGYLKHKINAVSLFYLSKPVRYQ